MPSAPPDRPANEHDGQFVQEVVEALPYQDPRLLAGAREGGQALAPRLSAMMVP